MIFPNITKKKVEKKVGKNENAGKKSGKKTKHSKLQERFKIESIS